MAFPLFGKKPPPAPKSPEPAGPAENDLTSLDFTRPGAFDAASPKYAIQVEEVSRHVPAAVEQAAMLFSAKQADAACAVLETALRDGGDLGERPRQAWDMLFDLYQLTGRREAFESLSLQFAARFETSPPAWTDGRLAARAPAARGAGPATVSLTGVLNANARPSLDRLPRIAEQTPVVRLDLGKIVDADEAGCAALCEAVAAIRKAKREIVMGGAERLAGILAGKIEPGVRGNEHVWLLLLELYQQLSRQQAFEETAVNYAITFEVSPPSWSVPAADGAPAQPEASAGPPAGGCVLEGEIAAAGAEAFAGIRAQAEKGDEVAVDCRPLLRMDFVSAAELLNVAGSLQAAGKRVRLQGVNHLVAALWEVIGLDRVAEIETRKN